MVYETQDAGRGVSIREQMKEMEARLDNVTKGTDKKGIKGKVYKLPFMVRMRLKSEMKKNRILCLHLRASHRAEIKFYQIENGYIVVPDKKSGDQYHNASESFVWYLNGKTPLFVLKDWSVDPVGDKNYDQMLSHVMGSEEYKKDVEAGRLIVPQRITLRAIEAREALLKKPMDGMIWVFVIIGIAVVGYLIFSQMKK